VYRVRAHGSSGEPVVTTIRQDVQSGGVSAIAVDDARARVWVASRNTLVVACWSLPWLEPLLSVSIVSALPVVVTSNSGSGAGTGGADDDSDDDGEGRSVHSQLCVVPGGVLYGDRHTPTLIAIGEEGSTLVAPKVDRTVVKGGVCGIANAGLDRAMLVATVHSLMMLTR
jgi:hypothetical protein